MFNRNDKFREGFFGEFMIRGQKFWYLLLAALLLALLPTMQAQTVTTGDIAGVVRDATGAVVPNAQVTLKNSDTGDTRVVQTNESGGYRFTFVKPGNYQVSAKVPGLQTDVVKVRIDVGQAPSVDLVAKVQATQEVIEVTGAAPPLNTENANLSETFSSRQMAELPAPGGDLTTIAYTAPGVVMSTGMGYGNFSTHGLPGTSNLFTINGNDYNDPYLNLNNSGASNNLLGQNEIQEAAVISNAYSVQYGRQAGAQVNYVTKSGSNTWHGNALWNWNGTTLDANSFFNNRDGIPRPGTISNQWADSLGGAIIKNKLFFYVDNEGLYYTIAATGVVSYPSQQLQQYILSTINPAQDALYNKAFSIWQGAPGASHAVPITTGSGATQDASGTLGCGPSFAGTNTPAPGGGIFGQTVPCGQAFATAAPNQNREWLLTTRIDYNINDNNKLNFRFKHDTGFQPTGTSLLTPVLNEQSIQPQYEGQVNYTTVISPTIVNNFIGSVLWYSAIFGPANVSAASNLFPSYFGFSEGGTNSGAFTGMGDFWAAFPQGRNVGQGQLIDDLSITKGNHTIKIGANYRKNDVSDHGLNTGVIGSYFFSPLTDFVNGTLNNGSYYFQSFPSITVAHIRFYDLGAYIQDEWAAKPNLKLTFGVRFDRTANPSCVETCFSNLNAPFMTSAFTGGLDTPYNSILHDGSNAYYSVDAVDIDPRFGIVWSPRGVNKTVIRAGIGLFSDMAPGFLVSNVFSNPPSPFQVAVFNGQTVNLANDPTSAAAAALASYQAFHTGFVNGATYNQLNNAIPGGFSPPNVFSIPQHMSSPRYLEYSFEVEQPLDSKDILTFTYSGNRGFNLLAMTQFPNAYNSSGAPFAGLPTSPKDAAFNSVTEIANSGLSRYNALSITYKRAFSSGLQAEVSYTYSHALDTLSNGGTGLPFSFQPGTGFTSISTPSFANNYANSDYDLRHNLVGDLTYDTPWKFHNRIVNAVGGGWTVAGKFFLRSGMPFSITDSLLGPTIDPSLGAPLLAGYSGLGGPVAHTCGASQVDIPCFTTSQFLPAGTEGAFGNVGRNSFYGPDWFDIDMSMYKTFAITERISFRIGAQAYNVLNHPNFMNPAQDIAGGGFGLIQATAAQTTGPYGSFQGSSVAAGQRLLVLSASVMF